MYICLTVEIGSYNVRTLQDLMDASPIRLRPIDVLSAIRKLEVQEERTMVARVTLSARI